VGAGAVGCGEAGERAVDRGVLGIMMERGRLKWCVIMWMMAGNK